MKSKSNNNSIDAALPVIDIGNDLTTCIAFVSAVQTASLPSVITGDPTYQELATAYAAWQSTVWDQLYLSLINGGVVPQVLEMSTYIAAGVDTQSVFRGVIMPAGTSEPTVMSLCVAMAEQVSAGQAYLQQLIQAAKSIKGGDEAKLEQLESQIQTLNQQFDTYEEQLTEEALDDSKQAVITVIEIGVALGTDGDPIAPVIKGIAQVGTDIIDQLTLGSEILETLGALETDWAEADEITQQIAQLNLILSRLSAVVSDGSPTLNALRALIDDWQQVAGAILCPASEWASTGFPLVQAWVAQMARISFPAPVSQVVSPSSSS